MTSDNINQGVEEAIAGCSYAQQERQRMQQREIKLSEIAHAIYGDGAERNASCRKVASLVQRVEECISQARPCIISSKELAQKAGVQPNEVNYYLNSCEAQRYLFFNGYVSLELKGSVLQATYYNPEIVEQMRNHPDFSKGEYKRRGVCVDSLFTIAKLIELVINKYRTNGCIHKAEMARALNVRYSQLQRTLKFPFVKTYLGERGIERITKTKEYAPGKEPVRKLDCDEAWALLEDVARSGTQLRTAVKQFKEIGVSISYQGVSDNLCSAGLYSQWRENNPFARKQQKGQK